MSSRLFQEIREKRGLCYSIFSFTQMQNSSGVFGFYAGTSPNDVDQLLEASLIEWKKIKKFISSEELDRAKSQMKSGFIMGQESNSYRSEYFAKNMIKFFFCMIDGLVPFQFALGVTFKFLGCYVCRLDCHTHSITHERGNEP